MSAPSGRGGVFGFEVVRWDPLGTGGCGGILGRGVVLSLGGVPGVCLGTGLIIGGGLGLKRRLDVVGIDVVCWGAAVVGCTSGLVKISTL